DQVQQGDCLQTDQQGQIGGGSAGIFWFYFNHRANGGRAAHRGGSANGTGGFFLDQAIDGGRGRGFGVGGSGGIVRRGVRALQADLQARGNGGRQQHQAGGCGDQRQAAGFRRG